MFKLLKEGIRKGKGVDDIDVESLTKVLQYGQASGAACVTEIGTTPGVTKKNIEKIIKEQGPEILNSTKIVNI